MTGPEIWFLVSLPLAGALIVLSTYVVIRLDKPRAKRKP